MRLVRFTDGGRPRQGCLEITGEADVVRRWDPHTGAGAVVGPVSELELLAPCAPRTIVGVGSNYPCQLAERGRPHPVEPVLFLKTPNAVIGPGEPIRRPAAVNRLEYEGELAVVIGAVACDVAESDAWSYVLGVTCANDVTAHDWRADGQWTRAKSADTFCPLGPCIQTDRPALPRTLSTRLGPTTVQRSDTGRMIFDVPRLLAWITRWITLQPGDVVLTGSPGGVGPMVAGDEVTVAVDGIGELANPVVARG